MDPQELLIRRAVKKIASEPGPLDRTHCLNEDTLIQYIKGMVKPEERTSIIEHLAQCSRCLDILIEFQQLETVRAEDLDIEVPESTMSRLLDLMPERQIAEIQIPESTMPVQAEPLFDVILRSTRRGFQLIKRALDITPVVMETAALPVRGALDNVKASEDMPAHTSEVFCFRKVMGEFTIETWVEKSGTGLFNLRVKVSDSTTGKPIDGIRVTLCNEEFELESIPAEQGIAFFEDFEEGNYRLEIKDLVSLRTGRITFRIEQE